MKDRGLPIRRADPEEGRHVAARDRISLGRGLCCPERTGMEQGRGKAAQGRPKTRMLPIKWEKAPQAGCLSGSVRGSYDA